MTTNNFLAAFLVVLLFTLQPATAQEEGIAISLREMKGQLDTREAKSFYGTTRLLGFLIAEDKRGKDVILVFAKEPNRPPLKLDDLAIAYRNVKAGAARPACTIDPRPATLKKLGETFQKFSAPGNPEAHFKEWKEVAALPQDVRVFNVNADTSFARTMVDADYLLKTICDGTDTIPGITGYADLMVKQAKEEIAKNGRLGSSPDFANRFWFNAGKVSYQSDGKLFLLNNCEVTLLTEREAVNQEGKRTPSGKGDPLAKEFTDQFTANFAEAAKAKPIYRELENLYRAVAVAGLLYAEAKKADSLRAPDDTLGKSELASVKATPTLPGRGTVKKVEGKTAGGTYTLWLPSCGGVSIDIQSATAPKNPDPAQRLPKITQTILTKRPEPTTVSWAFTMPEKGK